MTILLSMVNMLIFIVWLRLELKVYLPSSDSTNAEKPGFTPSEKNVGVVLEDIFRKASQRVVVATFASNVHRIQQVIDAAEATGRKVTVIGRSMVNVVRLLLNLVI